MVAHTICAAASRDCTDAAAPMAAGPRTQHTKTQKGRSPREAWQASASRPLHNVSLAAIDTSGFITPLTKNAQITMNDLTQLITKHKRAFLIYNTQYMIHTP